VASADTVGIRGFVGASRFVAFLQHAKDFYARS
jgi:hypothetical protein